MTHLPADRSGVCEYGVTEGDLSRMLGQSFLVRIVILIVLLPLLAIAGFLWGVASYNFFLRTFVRPKELREVKPKGDLLMKALIRFQAANGEFPERIEDIVPAFVEEIPQVAYGSGHWEYIRNFGVSPSPNFWLQVRNKGGRRNEGYYLFVTKGRHGVNPGSWQYDNSLSDITEMNTDGNAGTGNEGTATNALKMPTVPKAMDKPANGL